MTKRMLVDAAHPEETRVAIVDGNWLSDFDFERTSKKQLKGNIYLAKVIRVEPSLQAAFVEYGGNRHGFLPFTEIHPDYFRIPVADRPHDEEVLDGESDDTAEDAEVSTAAYGDYQEEGSLSETPPLDEAHPHSAEAAHDGDASMAAEISPEALSAHDPATVSTVVSELSADPSHELGLITDFGNAALLPPALPGAMAEALPDAVPVETVGGEVGEEERYRRPPRPRYKIQEVVKRRQVMLIQVVKEERGNKGAALTTFLSLAGRYCVLMPNTDHGGGVSRKITNHQDRRRMKEILDQLEIPEGMAVILRTAGMEKDPPEIQHDLEYLLRLWNNIREQTLQSTAPTLIYEEANLIKRSMRDLFSNDVSEILVSGTRGHQLAVDFLRTIMPDQLDKVKLYEDAVPLFFRYNVEKQIDQLYSTTVQLRSGGYIVINPTEALVAIDVNSGRATRERHIESTALKTNLEAADEIARQLRLRDLAGLIVIDFIDMEDSRNNSAVERRMKEAMRGDRARLQIGRLSPFGLLELSRQRLHPSLMEINFEKCPHCAGVGLTRSIDSSAISILRVIEEDGIKNGAGEVMLHVPNKVALYILNQKRAALSDIERRYNVQVLLHSDDSLVPPDCRIERGRANGDLSRGPMVNVERLMAETEPMVRDPAHETAAVKDDDIVGSNENKNPYEPREISRENRGHEPREGHFSRRRGRFGGRNRPNNAQGTPASQASEARVAPEGGIASDEPNFNVAPLPFDGDDNIGNVANGAPDNFDQDDGDKNARGRGRRRGRRGGRNRRPGGPNAQGTHPRGPRESGPREGGPREGGPREGGHYRPREEGSWNNDAKPNTISQPSYPAAAPAAVYTATTAPVSIHDIDTTPREPGVRRETYTPVTQPLHKSSSEPSSPPPYEVVDKPSDKPKGGWWRKLTGQ